MNRSAWNRLAWIVVSLALVVTVFAPSLAEARLLIARIDEPFEVGGLEYPPGRLLVKSVRAYTPTTLLVEIRVDGECLGLFRATSAAGEGEESPASLTFERSAAGRLALVGFTLDGHPVHGSYRFEPPAGSELSEVARR